MNAMIKDYEYEYNVHIYQTGTGKKMKVTGYLFYMIIDYNNTDNIPFERMEKIEFDPLIILEDLKNTVTLNSLYESETPFIIEPNIQRFSFFQKINMLINEPQLCNLKELEKIKEEYNITLNLKIGIEKPNIFAELLEKKKHTYSKTYYESLKYEFGNSNHRILSEEYLKENHCFYYRCNTVLDILFAVLYFIIKHKYQFKKCALCERTYVKLPNKGQGKFCPRKSPLIQKRYFNFKKETIFDTNTNLSCGESVKKFRKLIEGRINTISYTISDDKKKEFEERINNFLNMVHDQPTVENLIKLFNYIDNYKKN